MGMQTTFMASLLVPCASAEDQLSPLWTFWQPTPRSRVEAPRYLYRKILGGPLTPSLRKGDYDLFTMELLVLRSLILHPNLLARTTHTPQDFHLKTDALRGEVQPLNALIYQLYSVPCGPPQGELVLYMFLCFFILQQGHVYCDWIVRVHPLSFTNRPWQLMVIHCRFVSF